MAKVIDESWTEVGVLEGVYIDPRWGTPAQGFNLLDGKPLRPEHDPLPDDVRELIREDNIGVTETMVRTWTKSLDCSFKEAYFAIEDYLRGGDGKPALNSTRSRLGWH